MKYSLFAVSALLGATLAAPTFHIDTTRSSLSSPTPPTKAVEPSNPPTAFDCEEDPYNTLCDPVPAPVPATAEKPQSTATEWGAPSSKDKPKPEQPAEAPADTPATPEEAPVEGPEPEPKASKTKPKPKNGLNDVGATEIVQNGVVLTIPNLLSGLSSWGF